MAGKRAARPPRKNRALRAGVAAVVGLLVMLLVGWGAYAVLGGDDDSAGTTTAQPTGGSGSDEAGGSSPTSSPSSSPSAAASQAPAALRACAREVAGAEKVVSAAEQGVADWRRHVQARTDMLDGRMSVSKMDAMWKRTRVAGPADQRRFKTATDAYDPSGACTKLDDVPAPDRSTADDCVTRYRDAEKAMAAAEAAMADWRSHLDNMAAYATGTMTSDEAQTKWVAAWRNAPPHIKAYEKARDALDDAPSCPA